MSGKRGGGNSRRGREARQRADWIDAIQTFQRIAGITVASTEALIADWDSMTSKQRAFNVENARTHRVIQDAAARAGIGRRN